MGGTSLRKLVKQTAVSKQEKEKKDVADRNYEAEQKAKEERQKRNMSLGSVISSGSSTLG